MDMTPKELGLFIDGRIERGQETLKLIQVGVASGYQSAKRGKLQQFEFEKERKKAKLTAKQVQSQKEYLKQRFKGGEF